MGGVYALIQSITSCGVIIMVLMRCVAIIQWQLKLMVSNGVSVFLTVFTLA